MERVFKLQQYGDAGCWVTLLIVITLQPGWNLNITIIAAGMSEHPVTEIPLNHILAQVVAKNKPLSFQQCEAVWDCFIKTIVSYADLKKSFLVLDMFYITNRNIRNFNLYEWSPTAALLSQCEISFGQEIPQLSMTIVLTKQKLGRACAKEQCLIELGVPEDVGWLVLEEIFKQIKGLLASSDNIELDLEFFGLLRVQNRQFQHILKEDKNMRIKKLLTPKKRSSNLRISRRQSQMSFLKDESQSILHQQPSILSQNKSLKQFKKTSFLSPINKPTHFINSLPQPQLRKQRSLLNTFLSPDARISNDLLGAGIDPLKFDYNYSKLVNQTGKLFSKTFTKPKPAKMRHPGIIDKFQRTTGVPQTGLKISSSVVIRIGANYNHHAKYLYADVNTKCIMFIPREPKITLTHNEHNRLQQLCATEEQQYQYVTGGGQQLARKVQNRLATYGRYVKYIEKYIQNSNVSPLERERIGRIVQQVKATVRNELTEGTSLQIMDRAINEANQAYYQAYKKSILDYVLKDQKQRQRTGIKIVFKPVIEWGQRKVPANSPRTQITPSKQFKLSAMKSLNERASYPGCVLEISELNLKMKDVDLFRIRSQETKPVNVLYFIKKQNTHIAEVMSYLSADWIKKAAEIVGRFIGRDEVADRKIVTFFKLINLMLSNTLKNIIAQSFRKLLGYFRRYTRQATLEHPPIIQISITDENGRFVYSDDFRKILTEQVRNLVRNIIDQSKKIHGIEFYLKDEANSFIWHGDNTAENSIYEDITRSIIEIVEENSRELEEYLAQFHTHTKILRFHEQTLEWVKQPRNIEQVSQKYNEISELQTQVQSIPYSHINKMVLVELFEEKQKLFAYLNNLKTPIYQNLQASAKRADQKCNIEIDDVKRKISCPIENTFDYLKVSVDLQQIRKRKVPEIHQQIQFANRCLLKLHELGYGFVYADTIYKVYKTNIALRNLQSKIDYHEDRISREKVQLQTGLREKIKQFQSRTMQQLSTVSARIDEFELRRVYNDYLIEMVSFKNIVDENQATVQELHKQQQNLKWNKSNFKVAEQLKNIVMPNYELWNLVLEYDCMMKQWRNKEICQMDVTQVKRRVEEINFRVSKAIKKLKNLSSLKVAYQLQKDTKDILSQHVQIIQIFSHPGLKQRHWQLFNTKLMIPGVDLKQIPYCKIKIFQQYEKNLKVLSVISTQAAKQYEIETEKNEQYDYWMSVNFDTYTSKTENNILVYESFFRHNLSLLEEHSNKLAVMKNYLYSKALYQQLQEWEQWLGLCRKNLEHMSTVQREMGTLRPLFTYEQMGKELPIEMSEFESIEGCWKTLTKKIWENPKLAEFVRNPKIAEMLDELIKKIEHVKKNVGVFLMAVRAEFPRFYFLTGDELVRILVKGAYPSTEKQSLSLAFSSTFSPSLKLNQNDQKFLSVQCRHDSLTLNSDVYQLKTRRKLCQNMSFLQRSIQQTIKNEIIELSLISETPENIVKMAQKYCLTSIMCHLNIRYARDLQQAIKFDQFDQAIQQRYKTINKISSFLKSSSLKDTDAPTPSLLISKLEKLLLSFIGDLEKLQQIRQSGVNLESYEHLSKPRFKLINKDQLKNLHLQAPAKNPKQKVSEALKTISSMRRASRSNLAAVSAPNLSAYSIQVHIMQSSLEYNQQFYGDQTHNYLPACSDRAILALLSAITHNNSLALVTPAMTNLVYRLAIVCGQPFAQLKHPYFHQQSAFNCILYGLMVSSTWMVADAKKMGLSHRHYDRLQALVAEIRARRKQSPAEQGPVSTYVKCLGQMCNIGFSSVCMLAFEGREQYREVPAAFRVSMRSVALVMPNLMEMTGSVSFAELVKLGGSGGVMRGRLHQILGLYVRGDKMRSQEELLDKLNGLQSNGNKNELRLQVLAEYYPEPRLIDTLHQTLAPDSQPRLSSAHRSHPSLLTPSSAPKPTLRSQHLHHISQLCQSVSCHSLTLVYGSFDIKAQLIQQAINQVPGYHKLDRSMYSFPGYVWQRPQPMLESVVREVVSELNRVLVGKMYSKEVREGRRQVCVHVQYAGQVEDALVRRLWEAAKKVEATGMQQENGERTEIQVSFIIECQSIGHLSPSTCLLVHKICVEIPDNLDLNQYFSEWLIDNIKLDKQRSYDSRVDYQSVMFQLRQLQPIFESVVSMSLRALSVKLTRPPIHKKYILTQRFLRMFKIYIDHLDDKQIDQYVQFDVKSYIRNSFLYCVYWTICMGFLQPHEHFIVEQVLLKQHFKQQTEIEQISKYMLNEENQWLSWSSLKQQFGLAEAKNSVIYNVWVSTEQNMKMYTNVIKMLEKGLRIMVVGERGSGKSVLLKQICNFEMSYNSFLIDCHRLTSVDTVSEVIKNHIFYTKTDKKLILVDDVSLPEKQLLITQVLRKIMDEGILTCRFMHTPLGYSNKVLSSKINTLVTYSTNQLQEVQNSESFLQLQSKMQRINMKTYQDSELSTIYGAYLKYQFDRLKLNHTVNSIDLLSAFNNLLTRLYKKFHLDLHSTNKIVRAFLTKLVHVYDTTPSITVPGADKKQDNQSTGTITPSMISTEERKTMGLLEMLMEVNSAVWKNLGTRHNFETIAQFCYEETNRMLAQAHFKSHEQFNLKINNEKFLYLPISLAPLNHPTLSSPQRTLRDKYQCLSSILQQFLCSQCPSLAFLPSSQHLTLILRLASLLRSTPAHAILLCEPSSKSEQEGRWLQGSGYGCRTLSRIVALVNGFGFRELQCEAVTGFVNESLGIIKVGGKVDESVYYLSRGELQGCWEGIRGRREDMLHVVNSMVASPELYEFMSEERIEQVFVKFSSEKKTLKRSEFIKKVRDKINSLFHFVIAVDAQGLANLRATFPSLVKQSYIVSVHKLPQQALYQVSNRALKSVPLPKKPPTTASQNLGSSSTGQLSTIQQQKHRRALSNTLVQAYTKFQSLLRTKFKQSNSSYVHRYKAINLYRYFDTFRRLLKRYEQIGKMDEQVGLGELWQAKKAEMEAKYEQLMGERGNVQSGEDGAMGENEARAAVQEQLIKALNQLEDTLRIVKHIEKCLQADKPPKDAPRTPLTRVLGNIVLITTLLQFDCYIGTETDKSKFYTQIKQCIRTNGLDFDQNNCCHVLLNKEDKFRRGYQLIQPRMSQNIAQVAIRSQICAVLWAEEDRLALMAEWAGRVFQETGKFVENNQIGDINECISNGQLAFVVNPSKYLLKKLRKLITNCFLQRNATIYVQTSEQIPMHQKSRVVFIFTHAPEQTHLNNTVLNGLWQVQYRHRAQSDQQKVQRLLDAICRQAKRRDQLVGECLAVEEELGRVERKVERSVGVARKVNETADAVIVKIEGLLEERAKLREKLGALGNSLDQIVKEIQKQKQMGSFHEGVYEVVEKFRSMEIFDTFIKYMTAVACRGDVGLPEAIKQAKMFVQMFENGNRDQRGGSTLHINSSEDLPKHWHESETKFKKIDRAQSSDPLISCIRTRLAELRSNPSVLEVPLPHEPWTLVLQNCLNLGPPAPITPKLKKLASTNLPISGSHLPILIIRSDNPSGFWHKLELILTQHGQQILVRNPSNPQQLSHMTNPLFHSMINLLTVKSHKDWKPVLTILAQYTDRPQKCPKVIVLCLEGLRVPAVLEHRCFVVVGRERQHEAVVEIGRGLGAEGVEVKGVLTELGAQEGLEGQVMFVKDVLEAQV